MHKFALSVVFAFLILLPAYTYSSQGELTFISSEEELNEAIKAEKIKGLAVRSEFYNKAGIAVKAKISYLISFNQNKLAPIFFYGYDIDVTEFNKLLGKTLSFNCKPLIMAGYFGTIPLSEEDFRGRDIPMCFYGEVGDLRSDEDWFREWIAKNWLIWKEEQRTLGNATLN